MVKLNFSNCFWEAISGFKSWWIPLCIVATIILFSQAWLPKWFLNDELLNLKPYSTAYEDFKADFLKNPFQIIELNQKYFEKNIEISCRPEIRKSMLLLIKKGIVVMAALAGFICLLNVFMTIIAKAAVQKNKNNITLKRDFSKSFYLFLSYFLLAIIKMIPFFFCILPGIYVYIKLYYTGFIITEESANPLASISKSWKMTAGNFFPVLLIFAVTLAVNIISLITIIGIIPGSSFNYILRAASYKQLKQA